MTNKTTMVP